MLVVAGCWGGQRRARIGVALPADTSAELTTLRGAMQHAADSLGLDLEIRTDGSDAAAEARILSGFVAGRVNAIVVVPVAPSGLTDALRAADRAHIPVFTAGRGAVEGPAVSRVAADDRQGGELLGWYLGQRLRGGNVAVLDGGEVSGPSDCLRGVRLALGPFPNIRLVASPVVDPATRDAARHKTATLLASDERIDAVIGTTGELALGALAAVQDAGRRDVLVVANGGGPEARAAILGGTPLVADVVTDPGVVGRYVVEVAASHLRGNHVMAAVPVRVRLVDRDSLTAPRGAVEPRPR